MPYTTKKIDVTDHDRRLPGKKKQIHIDTYKRKQKVGTQVNTVSRQRKERVVSSRFGGEMATTPILGENPNSMYVSGVYYEKRSDGWYSDLGTPNQMHKDKSTDPLSKWMEMAERNEKTRIPPKKNGQKDTLIHDLKMARAE